MNTGCRFYQWHKRRVKLITKAPFSKGIKRNALIELAGGERIVVPWRSLRKEKQRDLKADNNVYRQE